MKNIAEYEKFLEDKKEDKIERGDQKFYLVNTKSDKIWSGWEFREEATKDKKSKEETFGKAQFKVHSKSYLNGRNVDTSDHSNWETGKEKDEYRTEPKK